MRKLKKLKEENKNKELQLEILKQEKEILKLFINFSGQTLYHFSF